MTTGAQQHKVKGAFSVWLEAAWWHPLAWAGLLAGVLWLWLTSEVAAYHYQYPLSAGGPLARWHPNLGGPSVGVGPVRLYVPGAFIVWAYRYAALRPIILEAALQAGALAGLLWAAVSIALSWPNLTGWVFASPRTSDSKGGAKWARERALKAAGFLHRAPVPGILLAQEGTALVDKDPLTRRLVTKRAGRLVISPGTGGDEGHIKVLAETRSGKTSGIVTPTLLTQYLQSMVVWDTKRELWEATALWRLSGRAAEGPALGRRPRGSPVPSIPVRFEPCSPDSAHYNPLLEVRRGPHAVGEAMAIARALIPANHPGKDQFWADAPYDLLSSAILHVLHAEPDKSLAGVHRFLSDPSRKLEETLKRMRDTAHVDGQPMEAIASSAAALLNMADKTRGEVFGTTHAQLAKLVKDPLVAEATSGFSDFRPWEFQYGPHPLSLYLVPPQDPTARETVLPLLRLVLNQILGRLHAAPPDCVHADTACRPTVLMLDEFPTIGPLPAFDATLSTIGGRGVRAVLVCQNEAQLEHHYGRTAAATISANCATKVVFAANHFPTAEAISNEIGSETRQVEHTTQQNKGSMLGAWQAGSRSVHEEGRPLLFPSELRELPASDAILFLPGLPPYRAKKLRHYDHPEIAPFAREAEALRAIPALANWEERLLAERLEAGVIGPGANCSWTESGPPGAPAAKPAALSAASWVEAVLEGQEGAGEPAAGGDVPEEPAVSALTRIRRASRRAPSATSGAGPVDATSGEPDPAE